MIEFKDLRISPNGKTLLIGAAMPEYAFYENMYIYSIEATLGKYASSGRISLYSRGEDTADRKEVWIDVEPSDIDDSLTTFDNQLVFVYVTIDGTADGLTTPCGYDVQETIGVTYCKRLIYKKAMALMRTGLSCGKVATSEFINFYLRWKQLDLALKTGNYELASELFDSSDGVFGSLTDGTVQSISTCGCNS